MDPNQVQILNILLRTPSQEALLKLISWIDLECVAAPLDAFPRQVLAKALVVLGGLLNQKHKNPNILKTVKAAQSYLEDPTDETYAYYENAATNSYPFGPGEGCFCVEETGFSGCRPGSGCRSGAGSLFQYHPWTAKEVFAEMSRVLVPWIKRC